MQMTKPVQLSDEAYRRLKSLRRREESFSDVVLRLTERGSLADLGKIRQAPADVRKYRALLKEIDTLDRR